jgi:hypothetical protein
METDAGQDSEIDVGLQTEALMTGLTYRSATSAERYAECATNEVVSGFSGRVLNDNFTDLSVYCRTRKTDGSLDFTNRRVIAGNFGEEVLYIAPVGHVIVGIGGQVSSDDNLNKIVAKICRWGTGGIAETPNIGPACSMAAVLKDSTPPEGTPTGDTTSERFVDSHLDSQGRPKTWGVEEHTALLGIGMTSHDHNISGIQAKYVNW